MAQDLTRAIKVYLDSSQYAQSLKSMEAELENYRKKLDDLRTAGDAQKVTINNVTVALGAMKQQLAALEAAGEGDSEQALELRQRTFAYEQTLRGLNEALKENVRETKRAEVNVASMEKKVDAQRQKTEQLRQTLNNLSGATYSQLKMAQAALKRELRELVPGTEQYNRTLELLRQTAVRVKAADSQWNNELAKKQGLLSRAARAVNRYMLLVTTSATSITALIAAGRRSIQAFAELEDAEAKVRKYTGLTSDEVVRLRHELASIDTRTSQMALTELAASAGRLGIKGVEDLRRFVDAADKINISLGEDLGAEAVTNIGKLANLFGEDKRLGLDKAMLSTASAVTVLAKNSTAAEPYLVEFASRMGGVSATMKIAQSDILGMASALDQNMQKVEMSATAMQTLLVNMFRDPARFARIAGFEVKAFTDLLNTDANEAVIQFLESLHSKGGFEQLAPLFADMQMQGKRAIQVISTLAGHTDQLREAQELAGEAYEEGTEYLNEFNIMNETTQARLEKARKRLQELRVELGEKLKPILSNIYTIGGLLVRLLSTLVDWISRNGRALAIITGTILACNVALKAHVIQQQLVVLWNERIKVSLKNLHAVLIANPWMVVATVVAVFISRLKDMNLHLAESIKKTNVLAGLRAKASQSVQEQVKELKTYLDIAKDTNKSDEERLTALRRLRDMNPEYLGCIDGQRLKTEEAAAAVNRYIQVLQIQAEIEESIERQRQLREQQQSIDQQKAAMDGKTVLTSWEKMSAAAKGVWEVLTNPIWKPFSQTFKPTYDYLTDGQFDEATAALDDQYGKLEAHIEQLRESLVKLMSEPLKVKPTTPPGGSGLGLSIDYLVEKYEGEDGLITLLNEQYEDDKRNFARQLAQKLITKEQYNVRMAELDRQHYTVLTRLYDDYHAEMSRVQEDKESKRTSKLRTIHREREKADDESAKARIRIEEALHESLAKLEESASISSKKGDPYGTVSKEYDQRTKTLKEYYETAKAANARLYTDEEEHRAADLQVHMLYTQGRLALDKWYTDERASIDRSERRRAFNEERRGLTAEEKWHGMLVQDSIVSEYELKRKELDLYLKYEYMTEAEHQRALRELRLSEVRAYYDQLKGYADTMIQSLQQAEIDAVEAKYEVLIKAAENNGDDTEALETEQANAKLEIQKKYALSNLVVKLSQITADTAVAIMTGFAQLGPVAGAAAAAMLAATGAAQYASALSEYNKVKGMGLSSAPSGNSASSPTPAMERVVQYAIGRYDVIGASDGKTYSRVPFVGSPVTGIVSQPALIAESGAELIVNAADLRRLQAHVNYGLVVEAINDARKGVVPQRAEGNYTALPPKASHVSTSVDEAELLERLDEIKLLLGAWPTRLRSYVVLSDIDDASTLLQRSEAPFTRKDKRSYILNKPDR